MDIWEFAKLFYYSTFNIFHNEKQKQQRQTRIQILRRINYALMARRFSDGNIAITCSAHYMELF